MSEERPSPHLRSQGSALVLGVNAFAPFVERLNFDFDAGSFVDWPTVMLTRTMQATVISLFKLLPSAETNEGLVDSRSIATLVRNVIDTYDVMEMMVTSESADEHRLNRQILGYYISSRVAHIQGRIDQEAAQKAFPLAKDAYWAKIQKSPLYDNRRMAKLKSGESVFYRSRTERILSTCGKEAQFVSGILADLSTYVHSIPPSLWLGSASDVYSDNDHTRDLIAVWLRIANFYYACAIGLVLRATDYLRSTDLDSFLNHHKSVFSE